jgi:hypothetical protein
MVPQPRARPAYVLPSDMNFTPSINGRNGWDSEAFYEINAEVGQKMYHEPIDLIILYNIMLTEFVFLH